MAGRDEIECVYLTPYGIKVIIDDALEDCGLTLDELWAEIQEGRSSSEKARLAAFVVDGYGGFKDLREHVKVL